MITLLLSLLATLSSPGARAATPAQDPARVRLVVLVSVDQMIPEQLERLDPWLSGGFRRFAEGQVWKRAAHAHAATETGPGHATLGTGVHPSRSGIVGNDWLAPGTGADVYCAGDPDVLVLDSDGPRDGGGSSPRNLLAPGLAARLRAASPGSKSVGISGKDRSAILSTGAGADWALWWDLGGGGFVSSTYYGEELPAWVRDWDAGWTAGLDGFVWEDALPEGIEHAGTAPDVRSGEAGPPFPHAAPALSGTPDATALVALARFAFGSPLVDRFVVELAKEAVVNMDLGADDEVDYLFVGLSACDVVGHSYGPYSREVTDLLLRTDAELGTLFDLLDQRLGSDGWIAALSADHGVLELPESLAPRGFDAHRVSNNGLKEAGRELRDVLGETFGDDYLVHFGADGVSFENARMRADGVEPEEVHRLAAEVVLANLSWLERAVTREELQAAQGTDGDPDPLVVVLSRSFHPDRSPDVTLVAKPWRLLSGAGTTHGSPWPYDREVPLAFIGPGSPHESRYEPCWTVDVVPTLLHRAGVAVPAGLDGTVLD